MFDVGIDHVRLQVNPGPWLQALATGNTTLLSFIDGELDTAIGDLTTAGLGVCLSSYMPGDTSWGDMTIVPWRLTAPTAQSSATPVLRPGTFYLNPVTTSANVIKP
jgi:hypothetical protein